MLFRINIQVTRMTSEAQPTVPCAAAPPSAPTLTPIFCVSPFIPATLALRFLKLTKTAALRAFALVVPLLGMIPEPPQAPPTSPPQMLLPKVSCDHPNVKSHPSVHPYPLP